MTLQFNISQLLKSGTGETREYEFESDRPIDLEEGVVRSIRGQVKFILTGFGIIARVDATSELELTCARCLESFRTTVRTQFEDEYQPEIDIATGLPSTLPRSEDAFIIPQSHQIDLTEALRQHLLLAVEIVPLCSGACKGLCPTCGVNRNRETCGCQGEQEAGPFAVLQQLLAETDEPSLKGH